MAEIHHCNAEVIIIEVGCKHRPTWTMHIGFDAKRLFNNTTGLGNYSRTLLYNLQEYYPQHQYSLYTPGIGQLGDIKPFLDEAHYRTVLPKGKFHPFWRSQGIRKQLVEDKVSIFHGLSHQIPRLRKHEDVRTLVTIHDLIFKEYPATYKPWDRAIYQRKFSHSINQADMVVAISEQTKQDILKYFPQVGEEKIKVVYQACQPVFYETWDMQQAEQEIEYLNLPSEFLLSVGSIIPRKNLSQVIKAYKMLPDDLQLPFVIVGNGRGYLLELKSQIAKAGLEKKIIWLHDVRRVEQLKALYMKASSVIYTSWYEGFGLPVVEAMLSNTPIVTSNVSSLPEAGGPASIQVDPLEQEEITEGIITSLSLSEAQVTLAYDHAITNFQPKKVTDELMEVYHALIG